METELICFDSCSSVWYLAYLLENFVCFQEKMERRNEKPGDGGGNGGGNGGGGGGGDGNNNDNAGQNQDKKKNPAPAPRTVKRKKKKGPSAAVRVPQGKSPIAIPCGDRGCNAFPDLS